MDCLLLAHDSRVHTQVQATTIGIKFPEEEDDHHPGIPIRLEISDALKWFCQKRRCLHLSNPDHERVDGTMLPNRKRAYWLNLAQNPPSLLHTNLDISDDADYHDTPIKKHSFARRRLSCVSEKNTTSFG